jgi:GMP synthase-like glutamine amidotransferase
VDATGLVIENDPTDDARRLGDWLTAAGLDLQVVRAHAGEPIPDELDGFAALVVLGGEQDAFDDPASVPNVAWFPKLESLLRKAVRHRVPTLAICLGAQLLAQAHGGQVQRGAGGPEIGPKLVARRDAADRDPLFASVPMLPDVLQWHRDEVAELPHGAVLLAASTDYPHQAFRVGDCAWGLQFHIECDPDMIGDWAADSEAQLAELGIDPATLVERTEAVMDDMAEVWQPFAARFASVARGELSTAPGIGQALPLLGH